MPTYDFERHLLATYPKMQPVADLLAGKIDSNRLKAFANRHHAEIRAYLDIKLPARMYLTPFHDSAAKRFFHEIYAEEQGRFGEQQNHADMFRPICNALGIGDHELAHEYASYSRRVKRIFLREPSREALVHELGVSFAWESFVEHLGQRLISVLRQEYGISDVSYFEEHVSADEKHSKEALGVLVRYADSELLVEIAKSAITNTLVDDCYLEWQL